MIVGTYTNNLKILLYINRCMSQIGGCIDEKQIKIKLCFIRDKQNKILISKFHLYNR